MIWGGIENFLYGSMMIRGMMRMLLLLFLLLLVPLCVRSDTRQAVRGLEGERGSGEGDRRRARCVLTCTLACGVPHTGSLFGPTGLRTHRK